MASELRPWISASSWSLRPVDAHLEDRWDRLALRSDASPFVRPGWVSAWLDAFGAGQTLRLLTVERAGELVGALPVLSGRRVLRSPTNAETPLFGPVFADADAAAQLAEALLAARVGQVDLRMLLAGSSFVEAVQQAAGRRGAAVLRQSLRQSPFVDVSGDIASFNRRLSRNRRQGLKRLENRLRDAGELTFDVQDGRTDLTTLLDIGFRLEARRWKLSVGSAILSRESTIRFYTSIARWAAEVGILRLTFLRLNGRPIAFAYNLQQGSSIYFLKPGMDDSLAKLGPGVVLARRLVEYAIGEPEVRMLDLGGRDEQYKLDMATGTAAQMRLRLFLGPFGRMERAAAASVGESRARVLERLPGRARSCLAAVRNRLKG